MGIHSRILLHWTGNGKDDIESKPEKDRPELYLERLRDYYENGLFAKMANEDAIRKMKVVRLIRLCFTEIRLSQARTHAGRYGRLAIGFTRDFIMSKGGRPVVYIPFEAEADGRLLEDSIRHVYDNSQGAVRKSAMWIMAYVKRMSNGKTEDYYEEMEWRLVYDESPVNRHFSKDDSAEDVRRLKFQASDVKVIVFPDEHTKRMALGDETMRKHFSGYMPLMTTLDDCSNF